MNRALSLSMLFVVPLSACVVCASCASVIGVEDPTLDPDALQPAKNGDASGGSDGGTRGTDASVDGAPPLSCTGATCADGRACCGNVCIDTKTNVSSCGTCGTACGTANGTPACTNGTCGWTCTTGYAHCGTTPSSGCETPVSTTTQCGTCTTNCNVTVANANGPSCLLTTLKCKYATCKSGFTDKDNNPENGCEAPCGANGQFCCPGDSCNGSLQCNSGRCAD